MSILTLTEYKTAMGITDNTNDTQLSALIAQANDFIEKFCLRNFGVGTYEEQREGIFAWDGRFMFVVKNKPIDKVNSVKVKFFSVTDELDVNLDYLDIFKNEGYCYYAYTFNPSIGVIRPEYRDTFYYTINYDGGMEAPETVKLACVYLVSDTFRYLSENRPNEGETNIQGVVDSVSIGDFKETYNNSKNNIFLQTHNEKTGMILSQTVRDLLIPYISNGVAQSWG